MDTDLKIVILKAKGGDFRAFCPRIPDFIGRGTDRDAAFDNLLDVILLSFPKFKKQLKALKAFEVEEILDELGKTSDQLVRERRRKLQQELKKAA